MGDFGRVPLGRDERVAINPHPFGQVGIENARCRRLWGFGWVANHQEGRAFFAPVVLVARKKVNEVVVLDIRIYLNNPAMVPVVRDRLLLEVGKLREVGK